MAGKITTVFFDLDGTLIDTEPAAAVAISTCFKEWKIEIDPKDAQFITGRKWSVVMDFLSKKYPLPLSADKALERLMEKYRSETQTMLPCVPGAVNCVKTLATRYPLALITGSGRDETEWALKKIGIDQHFRTILCAEDYGQSKPAPDGYLLALQKLGSKPTETLVFEDSHAGIQAARAAGLWVVAVNCTNHFNQDTSHAHQIVEDLSDVDVNWVQRFPAAAGK